MFWLIAGWVVCSVLSFGIYNHERKNRFPYFAVFPYAGAVILFGPVGLFASVMSHEGKWGFDLRPYTRDERWQVFDKEYNSHGHVFMTREEFDKEY